MNVIQIRNMLRAGTSPCGDGEIHLKESQIHTLEATVPSIKIHNSNATQYYFPKAGVYLSVVYRGGISSGFTDGSLFNAGPDHRALFHDDGVRKYIARENGKPFVFQTSADASDALEIYQALLWKNRKPYRIGISGYKTLYNSCPMDQYGHFSRLDKLSDYSSYYLSVESLSHNPELSEVIKNGGYDGSTVPTEYEYRTNQNLADRNREIKFRLGFESFVRNGALEDYNSAVEKFNYDIETCEKFLGMAKELRRWMKERPEMFIRRTPLKDRAGIKSSRLYRDKVAMEEADESRRSDLNDREFMLLKMERAVRD